ncbi:uncharacterized protein Z519_06596 [Cladophialophora bantiana CBS 173.52]|uniref:Uncharacterized protein n=1 Tax=Cladophialophora bantiana (strain ATCC 10958 / CBS 173.52 / CDC B-1940 / NIH 8579) TaxID=1442370 RepID=A0A0D2HHK4_CLAB1|nr:uncharacterized protein Z519_06596 [Cladophialophora bantiana CBS 173.52]KIW92748.1 hypothetical protein Z519_06596 [Cladophialophora bantiana CBS 173.52]
MNEYHRGFRVVAPTLILTNACRTTPVISRDRTTTTRKTPDTEKWATTTLTEAIAKDMLLETKIWDPPSPLMAPASKAEANISTQADITTSTGTTLVAIHHSSRPIPLTTADRKASGGNGGQPGSYYGREGFDCPHGFEARESNYGAGAGGHGYEQHGYDSMGTITMETDHLDTTSKNTIRTTGATSMATSKAGTDDIETIEIDLI